MLGKEGNLGLLLLRHAAYAATLLLGALLLSQILFEAVPGDPARRALGPYASEATVSQLRTEMGLDRPLAARMANNVLSTLTLDFGRSIVDGRSVAPEVRDKFMRTFSLGLQAVCLACAATLGLLAVTHFFPRVGVLVYLARAPAVLPSFLSAVLVALAAAIWMPNLFSFSVGGTGVPAPLLPSLVAAIYPGSVLVTSLASRFSSLRGASHYRSARAYGVGRARLFRDALLVPALPGIIALVIGQLSLVIFASLVIEIIFSLPGTGTLLLASIQNNDYPMLQGILIINAFVFVGLHFLAETLYPVLDPRIAR